MTLHRMIPYACLLSLSLILSACSDATATNEPTSEPQAKSVTRSECLAKEIKQDKIACFQKLTEQRKAELKTTQQRIKILKAENEKRRERNEALLKEFERGVLDEE